MIISSFTYTASRSFVETTQNLLGELVCYVLDKGENSGH